MKLLWLGLFCLWFTSLSAGEAFQFENQYYKFKIGSDFQTRICNDEGDFVIADSSNTPRIYDAKGNLVARLSRIVCWTSGPNDFRPAEIEKLSDRQIKVKFRKNDPKNKVDMSAELICTFGDGPCIRMELFVDTVLDPKLEARAKAEREAEAAKNNGAMPAPSKTISMFFEPEYGPEYTTQEDKDMRNRDRMFGPESKKIKMVKTGTWVRDAKGGVPYEVRGQLAKSIQPVYGSAYLIHDSMPSDYHNWHGRAQQVVRASAVENNGRMEYRKSICFLVLPHQNQEGEYLVSAVVNKRPAGLEVTTGKDFNLFDPSRESVKFNIEICNVTDTALQGEYNILIYDYSGRKLEDKNITLDLKPWDIKKFPYEFKPRQNDMYFIEVQGKAGGQEFFIRRNIGAMIPEKFTSLDNSIMGMSAFFPVPDYDKVYDLMQKVGVRWLRTGKTDEVGKYGMICVYSRGPGNAKKLVTDEQKKEYLKKCLEEAVSSGNPYWEFGNENNFGNNKAELVGYYAPWCKLLQEVAKENPELRSKVKITTCGLAGEDSRFLEGLHKEGLWDLFDAVSLHPGRLGQTPDNNGPAWAWNYLSAINATFGTIRHFRQPKELIMTEVYARTPPNKADSDSYRSSAENIILQAALAKMAGVKVFLFYQMHDATHADIRGFNNQDTEYHYGLLMRDGVVKPGLLAYATISKALDGATFIKRCSYAENQGQALHFTTPRGNMSIVYDRTDGYSAFNFDRKYGFTNPWEKHWKTEIRRTFVSNQKSVTAINEIGQKNEYLVKDGKVELTVSGAPLIVYGLEF